LTRTGSHFARKRYRDTLKRIRPLGKNGGRLDRQLSPGVAPLHLTCLARRFHRRASESAGVRIRQLRQCDEFQGSRAAVKA